MTLLAAVLSLFLVAEGQTPKTDPNVQQVVATFLTHVQAGRTDAAYAQMSAAARKVLGPAQLAAYVASRNRAMGKLVGVSNIRVSDIMESEHGMTIYEADVRFEKGSARAWFVLTNEDAGWRIQTYGVNLPEGTTAPYEPGEMPPIAHEILDLLKREGAVPLADRFSEKDLAEVEQSVEGARTRMKMLDEILGPLESYTLGAEDEDEEATCRTVRGEGKFANGTAPITLRLCWADGVWRLRHAQIVPPLANMTVLERSVEFALQGKAKVRCPRGAPFAVGGEVVCRVTPAGAAKPQDVTIRRNTETAWEIVGLADVND